MTKKRLPWMLVALMLLGASPTMAQFGGGYLTTSPSVGMGYGGMPYYGFGWGIGRHLTNNGSYGPRAVTWYTPGQGYSSSAGNGLPWQGYPVPQQAYPYPNGAGMGLDGLLAREGRYQQRLEALYALQQQAYVDRYNPVRDPSTMVASTQEVEKSKTKKQQSKQSASTKDEPSHLIPVNGTTSSDEYSSGNAETLSSEKKSSFVRKLNPSQAASKLPLHHPQRSAFP